MRFINRIVPRKRFCFVLFYSIQNLRNHFIWFHLILWLSDLFLKIAWPFKRMGQKHVFLLLMRFNLFCQLGNSSCIAGITCHPTWFFFMLWNPKIQSWSSSSSGLLLSVPVCPVCSCSFPVPLTIIWYVVLCMCVAEGPFIRFAV